MMKDVINEVLKNRRSIGQTKRHDQILKMTLRSIKGHFPFVPFFDSYKIICPPQIQLREHLGADNLIEQIWDQRKGIGITDSNAINSGM